MISRLATAAALMAGATLLCVPAQAQTGTTGQTTIERGGASPSGSPGTTNRMQRDNTTMGTTDTMRSQHGTMQHGGMDYRQQAMPASGRMRGDAAERRMTECLNSAASQQRPLSSCQR